MSYDGVPSSSSSQGTTALKRTFSSGNTHRNSNEYNHSSSNSPSYTTSPANSVFDMASSNSNGEQQIPLMAGSDEQGHALGQSSGSGPSGKADYRMVGMGENDDSTGMGNRSVSAGASKAAGGMITMPEPAQHPAFPIASYCVSSIVMTVVNKFVLSGRHFTMNFLFLCIQSSVCVICVLSAKRAGTISVRDFDPENARKWFPISFLLVCVIYTGSKALQYLTIPVYTIFKNLTIILIAYGEVLWFGSSVTGITLISFGLMVVSSLIAAYDDIARFMYGSSAAPLLAAAASVPKGNSPAGYMWMLVNCLVSAGYVLGMRKRIKTFSFKDWDSMYYNNLLSIPVLIVFSLLFEGWSYETFSLNFPEEGRFRLMFAMFFSGLVTVFISYTTAWCVRVTSSTTYSMVGALNKLPVAASGLIFFGDPVTFGSVSAIFTGFVAGLVYAIAKQSQAAQVKKGPGGIEMGGKPR